MKKFKWLIAFILLVISIGMSLVAYNTMMNYSDFGDPSEYLRFKDYIIEARRAAMPNSIISIALLVSAYVLIFIPRDK